jgi:YesN/AraC family two-component response regulator
MGNTKDELLEDKILNILSSYQHPPYVLEKKLIVSIKQMDEKGSVAILDQINRLERAHLADSPLRSTKNSIIGSCTLFTRALIEVGVDSESAFMLSDFCIRKIEECNTTAQTEQFEYEMLQKFIELLSKNDQSKYSTSVNKSISFIKQNIQHKITLQNIADNVNVHPNYLSTAFKKEVGMSITNFIEKQKSEAIRLFLIETSLSLTDIAFTFEFCSVAYFSGYFKRCFGVSPLKYRQMHSNQE